jgi:SAM-dependent methyltransferase
MTSDQRGAIETDLACEVTDRRAGNKRPASTLKRAWEIWRESGLAVLFGKVLGETVYRQLLCFERTLEDPIAPAPAIPGVTVEELPASRAHELGRLRPDTNLDEIAGRFREGQRCFVASMQGRIVHARWLSTGKAWCDVLRTELLLAPGAVYLYGSFTVRELRTIGIARAVGKFCLRRLREDGFQSVVAVVDPWNREGRRALENAGWNNRGRLGLLRLGSWRSLIGGNHAECFRRKAASADSTYWDSVAELVLKDDRYSDPFLGRLKRRAHLRLISRWAGGLAASGKTLKTDLFEEANGADALVPFLCRRGMSVVGIDISSKIAASANAKLKGKGTIMAADARSLPFGSGSFDLVISPSTLDHFRDPRDLNPSLRELHRVLRPSGRLIITLDNRQNLFDPLLRLAAALGFAPYYLGRSYSMPELRIALGSAGFDVLEVTGILHSPRLTAVATTTIATRLKSRRLLRLVHRILLHAQRLEHTRWRYLTASFVCALAVPRVSVNDEGAREGAGREAVAASPPTINEH